MFGVGLHFHLKELLAVRRVALPGAVGQSLVATVLGCLVVMAFGWTLSAGIVFGLAISVASTVVLLAACWPTTTTCTPRPAYCDWLADRRRPLHRAGASVDARALRGRRRGPGDDRHEPGAGSAEVIAMVRWCLLSAGGSFVFLTLVAQTRSRGIVHLDGAGAGTGDWRGSAQLFGVSMALGAFLAGYGRGAKRVQVRVPRHRRRLPMP